VRVELHGDEGIRLAADVLGPDDGPIVLLLHGGGQTRHSWSTTQRKLAALGWRAFSVDQRGHGDSEWASDADYSLSAFAADLTTLLRAMPGPAAIVGASLGGIAALIALGEPEQERITATALVLVDVAPRVEPDGVKRIVDFMKAYPNGFGSLEEASDALAEYNPHRPRPRTLDGLRKNVRQRSDGRWVWHWDPRYIAQSEFDEIDETRLGHVDTPRLERAARRVDVPTLLVRGSMSDLLVEDGVEQLLALMPTARAADVAGAGHMVVGDRNDAFNGAITSFLERTVRQARVGSAVSES
jgi:pimeloyl-ACP methyl ester carboxylesterase